VYIWDGIVSGASVGKPIPLHFKRDSNLVLYSVVNFKVRLAQKILKISAAFVR